MNISAAISWYERELNYLKAAPGINGCPMTLEWEEQINVHTTALAALRELEQVKRERNAAVSAVKPKAMARPAEGGVSMERLTKRSRGLALHHECFDVCGTCTGAPCPYIQPMVDRLAAYEDIGPVDYLRELVRAEKDGRLVVLPSAVNVNMLRAIVTASNALVFHPSIDPDTTFIYKQILYTFRECLENAFEEAEAALKGGAVRDDITHWMPLPEPPKEERNYDL